MLARASSATTSTRSPTASSIANRSCSRGDHQRSDDAAPFAAATATAPADEEPEEFSLDDAKSRITEFLQLDDFEQWSHSQHVRIKLIAPDFPRRLLHTVKWLGDVYDMPIEVINARLFETAPEQYSIAFERLLPLAGEEEFDLTVRELEDRKREDNIMRRPAAELVRRSLRRGPGPTRPRRRGAGLVVRSPIRRFELVSPDRSGECSGRWPARPRCLTP